MAVTAAGPDSPSSPSRAARRRHGTGPASVLALLVLQLAGGSAPATAGGGPREPEVVALDAEASRAVFHVRTRWGQRIAGRLPALGGERRVLADGRHQVRIALDAAGVELGGPGRLEEIARSDRFFDADAHPQIVFLSDPYPASVVEHGGQVHGWLEMRGVRRPESFTLEPASCPEPGTACPVIAHGSVDRGDYGMDAMRVALTGSVHFDLRLWLEPMP